MVAAYRDRYHVTDEALFGTSPESVVQKIDAARVLAAVARARDMAEDVESAVWDDCRQWCDRPYICRDTHTRSASGPKYM